MSSSPRRTAGQPLLHYSDFDNDGQILSYLISLSFSFSFSSSALPPPQPLHHHHLLHLPTVTLITTRKPSSPTPLHVLTQRSNHSVFSSALQSILWLTTASTRRSNGLFQLSCMQSFPRLPLLPRFMTPCASSPSTRTSNMAIVIMNMVTMAMT